MLRAAILMLFTLPAFAASTLNGKVIEITDGNNLILLIEEVFVYHTSSTTKLRPIRIHLADIDSPEKGQPFGNEARQALADLAFEKDARVDVLDTDNLGRTVGRVLVGPTDVNAEMVRRGLAWANRKDLRDPSLLELEKEARQAGRGLWTDAYPIPPWEWRRGERESRQQFEEPTIKRGASFSCGSKRYCREMTSCEEAKFYFEQCGLTRLDPDNDGIPCERVCREYKSGNLPKFGIFE